MVAGHDVHAGGGDGGLEATVVAGPPATEGGHGIVAGVGRPGVNGVLGTGWRGSGAISRAATSRSLAFITAGPGGDEGFTQATPHDGIHQLGRSSVVAFKRTGEAIRGGIGAHGSIEQVG